MPTSVAVLTLGLLSRDTADAYLAEGLADAIASRLGRGGELVVTSRTYVRRLRGADSLPPADLGRALNAAYLVSGTLLRAGARLYVTVELVRAATGRQAWSEEYNRGADDVLAIESDVAAAIVARILGRSPAPSAAIVARPTPSGAAYDLYLRGRFLFNKQTRESLTQSLEYFNRAIALDSSFAQAYLAIAETYWWLSDDWMSPQQTYPKMREVVERALGSIAIWPAHMHC